MAGLVLVVYMLLVSAGCLANIEVQTSDHSSSIAAQSQLQKLQEQAEHMRYGKCWTAALEILKSGCRNMNDDTQRRIAYAFARCHLLASGRDIPECPQDKPIQQCTDSSSLSDLGFNTYTEFFTHSQQICFHLQSQAWHVATESTIDRLADNSQQVATHLQKSAVVAKQMMTQQNRSLKNQELLLEHEERLKISMQRSVLDVQRSHTETKQIINEQRALFHEVFDRVAVLQKTILGEFSSIYTFGFYVGSTILAYILTSTSYTSGARLPLFLILILNAVTERSISNFHINALDGESDFSSRAFGAIIPELIHGRIWLCRQIFCGFGLIVLFISVYRFKDYNKINNSLLNEIKRQNQQLQEYIRENIENTVNSPKSTSVMEREDFEDENTGKRILFHKMQNASGFELTHDETVISANTTLTQFEPVVNVTDYESDTTFRNSEIHESDPSFISVSSRSSVSTVRSRRSSTPLRDSLLSRHDTSNSSRTSVKKINRRSSVLAVVEESISFSSPPSNSVVIGGYSLRRRPDSPLVKKNLNPKESVEDFTSYMIDGLAEQSALRRNKIQRYIDDKTNEDK